MGAEITDVEWVSPGSLAEFGSVLDQYETGFRSFTSDDLASAWDSLPGDAILRYAGPLQRAFQFATSHAEDPVLVASKVLNDAWEFDAFQIDLGLDENHAPPIIYERPEHIWSRAWFELIEGLRNERLPKTCAHCGYHFVPRRINKRFCGDQCGRRAYEKKRSRDPERRKAQAARYLRRKEAAEQNRSSDGERPADDTGDQR